METKSKTIKIRITEGQFKNLINAINEQKLTTSEIVREAIDEKVKRVLKQTYNEKKKK